MRGRLRRYLPFLGWILGASLIPPTVFLSISYYEYVNSARTSLKVAVEEGVRRIDTVLRTGNEILLDVSNTIDPNDPEAEERLERIVYDNPLFREIGIVNEQGFLVLTNLGAVTPPELIDPEYRSDARTPTLQIVGRERTVVMGEESIILSLPTDGLGEVNALVNPVILTAPWGASQLLTLGNDGFLVYINTRNGQVLAGQGNLSALDTINLEQKAHRIQVSQTSQNGEVLVIAEVYQSDIGRVHLGQSATVRGQAFPGELTGSVIEIGRQVSRQNVFAREPGENLDRRVVEVKIALKPEDSERVANLSNLQVEAIIVVSRADQSSLGMTQPVVGLSNLDWQPVLFTPYSSALLF